MSGHSKRDMEQAAEFRGVIHREALARVRLIRPDVDTVVDRNPVDAYFREIWDYPGEWYTIVSIPYDYESREELIDDIVRATLENA